jgi:hypothetical protein
MKKGYGYILYFFLGLLILGGLALFIFRLSVTGFLREQTGLNAAAEVKLVVKKETLNTDILKTAPFTALKNNVINFNFDRICSQPVAAPRAVVVSSPTDNSTTTEAGPTGGCFLGSGLPFTAPGTKK